MSLFTLKRFLYLSQDALLKQFCVMLCDSCRTMTKELGNHLEPDAPVQTPGSVSMSGDVAEYGLINSADITNGLQISIDFLIGYHR